LALAPPVAAQDNVPQAGDENLPVDCGYLRCSLSSSEDIVPINDTDIVVTGTLPSAKGNITYPVTNIEVDNNIGSRLEKTLLQAAGLQQFRRSDARSANPNSQE